MKKLVLSVLLTSATLASFAPKKAEAGVLLATLSGGSSLLLIGGISVATVGAYTAAFSAIAPGASWFYPEYAIPGGIAMTVLDAQPNLTAEKDLFRAQLGLKYPFIENQAVLNEMVEAIYEKAQITTLKELKTETVVKFRAEEVEAWFQGEDRSLIVNDIEKLKKDFK